MMTLMIISCLMVVLYVGITVWRMRELPDSVSAMVYGLKPKWQWLWIVWMWGVAFTLAPALIAAMPDRWRFVGFLFIGSLVFCGGMPLTANEPNRGHYAFAIAAGIFSQLCVLILCPWWLMVWLGYVPLFIDSYIAPLYVTRWYDNKGVTVAEALCWVSLIGGVFYRLL